MVIKASILDKWEKVGRALGLTKKELSDIGKKYNNHPSRCFHHVLYSWVTTRNMQVTLRKFVNALKSEDVGEGNLADEINIGGNIAKWYAYHSLDVCGACMKDLVIPLPDLEK